MLVLMRCVAEAVMHKGVRGLTDLVPGASYLYEVANEAVKRMRDRKRAADLRQEVEDAAAATLDDVRRAAAEVAREVAGAGPVEDRIALEMYLTQLPGAIRQSLRRADDPSGKTVPPDLALDDAAELVRRLPPRVARFRPGDELPGRAGWRLAEFLGSGGFGEVWLAQNPALSALRGAVKFGLDPAARERLLRHEGSLVNRVMGQGRHPNVVQLLDAHLDGDAPWLMYEYVPGGDLTNLILAWQRLSAAERADRAVEALRVLASAVATFHRLSPPIVHRDLKPANVLLAGGDGPLKIADFGIGGVGAAAALAREATRRGSTGLLVSQLQGSFTPLYAGPQQQRGEPPDPRDDVHALGVIGFQMLTGRLDAAPGADYAKTLRRLDVPDGLVELVGDCAASDADNRPREAAELAERLGELTPVPPAPPVVSPGRVARPVPAPTPVRVEVAKPVPPPPPAAPAPVRVEVAKPAPRPEPKPAPTGPKQVPVAESPEAKRAGVAAIVVTLGVPILLTVALLIFALSRFVSSQADVPAAPHALVRKIDTPGWVVQSVRLSPDGTLLAAGLSDGRSAHRTGLYRLSDGGAVAEVPGQLGGFSPDGQRLAVSTTVGVGVQVLAAATGTKVYGLSTGHGPQAAADVGFAPDGRTVYAVADRVWLWDVNTPAANPRAVAGRDGSEPLPVGGGPVVFDPTGTRFAVHSPTLGGTVVGRVEGWKVQHLVGTKGDRLAAFTRSGDRLVTWDETGVAVRDADTGGQKAVRPTDCGDPRQLLLAPGGSRLIAVGSKRALALDPGGEAPAVSLGGRAAKVARAAFDPAGTLLATAEYQTGRVRVQDAQRLDESGEWLTGHTGAIRDVRFTADGKTLVAAGDDGIFVWAVR